MKKTSILWIAAFAFCAFLPEFSLHAHQDGDQEAPHYHEIHTRELKNLIDSGNKVVILDARPAEFDDKNRIHDAKLLPYNSSDKEISNLIPQKDTMVVVYCTSPECPASKYLADRLVKMGYTSVYKYPEGIQTWMEKHYPVQKAK